MSTPCLWGRKSNFNDKKLVQTPPLWGRKSNFQVVGVQVSDKKEEEKKAGRKSNLEMKYLPVTSSYHWPAPPSPSNWARMLTSQHNYNVCYQNHHNHNHQQWEIMNFVLSVWSLPRPASWRPAGSGIIPMFCVSKTGKSISCHFPVFVSLQSPSQPGTFLACRGWVLDVREFYKETKT